MATVRTMENIHLERDSEHTEVGATYAIINSNDGKCLQIDTYGSSTRQDKGKKSQSIRFTPEALEQLSKILKNMGYK